MEKLELDASKNPYSNVDSQKQKSFKARRVYPHRPTTSLVAAPPYGQTLSRNRKKFKRGKSAVIAQKNFQFSKNTFNDRYLNNSNASVGSIDGVKSQVSVQLTQKEPFLERFV